jgi:hypothetical protein
MSYISIYIREVETLGNPLAFRNRLEGHFNEICQRNEVPFICAYGYHKYGAGEATPVGADLVVYILSSASDSIIARVHKKKIGSGWAGCTYISAMGIISEIYLDHPANLTGRDAADMAFHELMHNKLRMGDELHGKSSGLGKGALGNQSSLGNYLTSDDINLMAPRMKDCNAQDSRW